MLFNCLLHRICNYRKTRTPPSNFDSSGLNIPLIVKSKKKKIFYWPHLVLIDLKGAPPKLSYLRQLFPLIASARANALLLEYEDMFPYQGSVANASALNSWSIDQVKELGRMAKQYGFQVGTVSFRLFYSHSTPPTSFCDCSEFLFKIRHKNKQFFTDNQRSLLIGISKLFFLVSTSW